MFALLTSCTTAAPSIRPYEVGTTRRATTAESVQVFWAEPPFKYEPIGEVIVDVGTLRNQKRIELKIRDAVAKLGGNIALVRDTQDKFAGAAHSRAFVVVGAIRR